MADPKGFMKYQRASIPNRNVEERVKDWREYEQTLDDKILNEQSARCMNCGVPFCQTGCPLGNIIPDWNDLVHRNLWEEALARLHATNNFPEFTGRLCPAPCEYSCVLGINQPAVTIKQIEKRIIDFGFEQGYIKPKPPKNRTNKTIAVIGSGPAGLAAAQQLNRAGHSVTVFERDDKIGGLMRYGIPDFKLEKSLLDRRVSQLEAEGIQFKTSVNAGKDITAEQLRGWFDAVCLTIGSTVPRDLRIPGRELKGVHFAMEYLTQQNRVNAGVNIPSEQRIDAKGKNVVIIGGGDTGADCLGTAHRHGANQVYQLEILSKPPISRTPSMPWPQYPFLFKSYGAHEEGGARDWGVNSVSFSGENGVVKKLNAVRVEWGGVSADGRREMNVIPNSEFKIPADLVFLAMGFVFPERKGLLEQLGVAIDSRGNIETNDSYQTSIPGVFSAGDSRRGQSLIVWAIREGREAARAIDEFLQQDSALPLAGAKLPKR